MRFTSLVAAASALLASTVVAAPVDTPLDRVLITAVTTVYFSHETSQDLIEEAGRAATKEGAQIVEYFGLPPNGHDMGFKLHITEAAAIAIMNVVDGKVGVNFQTGRGTVGSFCPKAVCPY